MRRENLHLLVYQCISFLLRISSVNMINLQEMVDLAALTEEVLKKRYPSCSLWLNLSVNTLV